MDLARERSYPSPYAQSPLLPLLLMSLATQKHSPDTKSDFKEEYDYIVVGAGSAGSVVASRLSEVPCISVLLLEAGPSPPRLTEIPAIAYTLLGSDIDWKYTTTPQKYTAAAMDGRKIHWPSGKAVGGSSVVNAMLYVRGNRRNYDIWEKLGATGWNYNKVLKYFKKLEDNTDPAYLNNGYHAVGGPITASTPHYNPKKKLALIEAARSLGINFVDPNAKEQIGMYDYQSSTRRGQRCSAAKGYLVPAENRTNLDILPNAMVRKVLIRNKRAFGVEFDYKNKTRQVRARKEVILSAGTINSAQLLMLSGIGPMSELKKHKIPVVADLPVGLNLQDHPASAITYQVDYNLPRYEQEIIKEKHIKDYINFREGPLTSSAGGLLMFFLSNPKSKEPCIPNYCLTILDFATETRVLPPGYPKNTNQSFITCASQLVNPYSRGTVSLRSSDPYDAPDIDPNYLSDFRDIRDIVEGFKMGDKIMNTAAMKKIGAKPLNYLMPGCEEFSNDYDLYLRCYARSVMSTTNHQVGTARMGNPNEATTVVDPELRVKGITGLRVVDASIMPTVPWSNTNIPTMMVGEKGSDIIKSGIRCTSRTFF